MLTIEKGYESTSKTFRLPIDLVNKMENIAAINKISLNNLVIQCLIYAVDHIDDSEKENSKVENVEKENSEKE